MIILSYGTLAVFIFLSIFRFVSTLYLVGLKHRMSLTVIYRAQHLLFIHFNDQSCFVSVAKVNLKLSPTVDKVQTKSKSPKEFHSKVLPSPQPKGQLRSRSQPATQKPSTKLSKLPITLNIADMITKTKVGTENNDIIILF